MSVDPIYLDQAGFTGGFVSACYTPHGIRRIDHEFCRRILDATNVSELQQIEKDLQENPHLHIEIKKNLVINLNKAHERVEANV